MNKDSNDPVFDQLLSLIHEHGWAVRHVGAGDEADFSYTVGLTALGHPEIAMKGLPFEVAQAFLNLMGEDVKAGQRFVPGSITTDLTEPPAPIAFISVDNIEGLTAVAEVYGQVEALQAIWSDSTGRLPCNRPTEIPRMRNLFWDQYPTHSSKFLGSRLIAPSSRKDP